MFLRPRVSPIHWTGLSVSIIYRLSLRFGFTLCKKIDNMIGRRGVRLFSYDFSLKFLIFCFSVLFCFGR